MRFAFAGQSLIEYPVDTGAGAGAGVQAVRDLVSSADAAMTNLECALVGRYGGWPTRDSTLHVAKPEVLDTLRSLGFDVLALASNHAFDLGPPGVATALEEVARRGFLHAGLGGDPREAAGPGTGERAGRPIGLVAVNASPKPEASGARRGDGLVPARPGTCRLTVRGTGPGAWGDADPVDLAVLLSAVRESAAGGRLTVAYVHQHYWASDVGTTPEWLVEVAHDCVDAGARAVVVHGPPVMHGLEIYAGTPVFYGLSSLFFHTARPERYPGRDAWESLVALCAFAPDGSLDGIELHPVVTGHHPTLTPEERALGAPSLARGEVAAAVLERFAERSARHGTGIEIDDADGLGRVVPARPPR